MTRPNILILMVDQLAGTLFPDGPAPFLHAPNLSRLAERSTRFANAYTASPLCAPGRASFMTGMLPSRTRVYDNAAEFTSDLPTFAHHLRRAGYATCLSGKMHFVGPDQLHGFEERLTTDIYPADFGWTPDWQQPDAPHRLVVPQPRLGHRGRHRRDHQPARLRRRGRLPGGGEALRPRPASRPAPLVPDGQLHPPARPLRRPPAPLGPLRRLPGPRPGRPADPVRRPGPAHAAADGRRRPRRLRDHPRACPPRPPRLLRLDLLRRREDRRAPRPPRPARPRRRHRGRLPLRPRRHARRARPLVQDELPRRLGPRAPDARRPRPRPGPRRPPGLDARPRADPDRACRHRPGGRRPLHRRRAPRRHRPRAGPDGVCRRRLPRADGRPPRRPAEARPRRERPAAPLRPRRRPARAPRTSPPTRPTPPTSPASPRSPAPAGTSPVSTPRSATARPAAASSTRRSATAPTTPGTTSRCAAPRSATCATT